MKTEIKPGDVVRLREFPIAVELTRKGQTFAYALEDYPAPNGELTVNLIDPDGDLHFVEDGGYAHHAYFEKVEAPQTIRMYGKTYRLTED